LSGQDQQRQRAAQRIQVPLSIVLTLLLLVAGGTTWITQAIDSAESANTQRLQQVREGVAENDNRLTSHARRIESLEREQSNIRNCLKSISNQLSDMSADIRVIRSQMEQTNGGYGGPGPGR
jgi:septal ring factor EnvC (AmiA/AmiB activator)